MQKVKPVDLRTRISNKAMKLIFMTNYVHLYRPLILSQKIKPVRARLKL